MKSIKLIRMCSGQGEEKDQPGSSEDFKIRLRSSDREHDKQKTNRMVLPFSSTCIQIFMYQESLGNSKTRNITITKGPPSEIWDK